jgi:hypothetical protein
MISHKAGMMIKRAGDALREDVPELLPRMVDEMTPI